MTTCTCGTTTLLHAQDCLHVKALRNKPRRHSWRLPDAIVLAQKCEAIAPRYGAHVALAGGCLNKAGARKDCDLMFYTRNRSGGMEPLKFKELIDALAKRVGLVAYVDFGFAVKATYKGKAVDLLFPDKSLLLAMPAKRRKRGTYKEPK